MRLSEDFGILFGAPAGPPPVQIGCTVQTVDNFPAYPVQVTAGPANVSLNPKHSPTYAWSTSGGQLTGKGETATVTTTGLAGGGYTIKGHISPGIRPSQQADCAARLRVHAYEPPTISCSARPTTPRTG